jgi:pimeloyl-ACP methyl ester carboxylesterase
MVHVHTRGSLTPEEQAGYDAPYPSYIYAIAPHVFPAMVPTITDDNVAAWESLGRFERPFLFLGGNLDPLGSVAVQTRHTDHIPGARGRSHDRYDAGHFIQEEIGEEMAGRLLRFVREDR